MILGVPCCLICSERLQLPMSKLRLGWYDVAVEATPGGGLVPWHVADCPRRTSPYYFLRRSEPIGTIIANKVGGDAANISVVRNGFLRSQEA